jgi:hypothetical protein
MATTTTTAERFMLARASNGPVKDWELYTGGVFDSYEEADDFIAQEHIRWGEDVSGLAICNAALLPVPSRRCWDWCPVSVAKAPAINQSEDLG